MDFTGRNQIVYRPPKSEGLSVTDAPWGLRAPGLALTDLFLDLDELTRLLAKCLAANQTLDAYLLAAGAVQVAADASHPDPLRLRRASARLRRRGGGPAATAAMTLAIAGTGAGWVVGRGPGQRATRTWLERASAVTSRLAATVIAAGEIDPELYAEVSALESGLARLPPAVRHDLLRLPSCFRSFDQSPADVAELAARCARLLASTDRPVLVCGIRSSGSYLAPLMAAWLQRLGLPAAGWITVRPGQPLLPGERIVIRQLARRRGFLLMMDDPPRRWETVLDSVRMLEEQGLAREDILLALAVLPESVTVPESLAPCPQVFLPWSEWSLIRRLAPERVKADLARLTGQPAIEVRAISAPLAGRRHAAAEYEVSASGGVPSKVRVRGVGLGYFGRHALAVATAMGRLVPAPIGLIDGLLFEAAEATEPADPAAIATYVAARADRVVASSDRAARLRYRGAHWQWCGALLAPLFGGAADAARPATSRTARYLLRPQRPVVVDGACEHEAFGLSSIGVVKRDYDGGVFGNSDLISYDPVFDLATAAVTAGSDTWARLRQEYEQLAGPISADRWMLHLAVQLRKRAQDGRISPAASARLLAEAFWGFYGETLLSGLDRSVSGDPAAPVAALDLDWVLETPALGFPATSPAGALALRALIAHGHRPVIATGRSLAEVAARCRLLGLAGAVAEYGSGLYINGRAEVVRLIDPPQVARLAEVRSVLAERPGVSVDPAFQLSVRAHWVPGPGRRPRALPEAEIDAFLRDTGFGPELRVIQGAAQTDFLAAGVDKSHGLARLLRELGGPAQAARLAFAAGDAESDLPMLRMAEAGYGPANAEPGLVRAGIKIMPGTCQRGLYQAVAAHLGHDPGACPACAPPELESTTRILIDLLAVQDRARVGRLGELIRWEWRSRRLDRG